MVNPTEPRREWTLGTAALSWKISFISCMCDLFFFSPFVLFNLLLQKRISHVREPAYLVAHTLVSGREACSQTEQGPNDEQHLNPPRRLLTHLLALGSLNKTKQNNKKSFLRGLFLRLFSSE